MILFLNFLTRLVRLEIKGRINVSNYTKEKIGRTNKNYNEGSEILPLRSKKARIFEILLRFTRSH